MRLNINNGLPPPTRRRRVVCRDSTGAIILSLALPNVDSMDTHARGCGSLVIELDEGVVPTIEEDFVIEYTPIEPEHPPVVQVDNGELEPTNPVVREVVVPFFGQEGDTQLVAEVEDTQPYPEEHESITHTQPLATSQSISTAGDGNAIVKP
jgi:hypothetical protein